MKARFILFLVLVFAIPGVCTSTPAEAATSYSYWLNYGTRLDQENGGWSWGTLSLASASGRSNGWDGEPVCPGVNDPTAVVVGLYNVNGINGWNASTGFYYADFNNNLSHGQTRVIDNIYVWAGLSADGYRMGLVQFGDYLSPGLNYQLSLISVPTGVSYTGPWQWSFGSTGNPTSIYLPMYRTDDGTTGYRFKVEFTTVPEPSSLLALFVGLAGIGTTVIRRRK